MKISVHILILMLTALFSCSSVQKNYTQINVTTIYEHPEIGIRALEIDGNKVYFAGRKGWVGVYDLQTNLTQTVQLDSALEFRSMAVNKGKIMISNILSPAYLFYGNSIHSLKKQLIENHPDAFYDALETTENGFGVMLGDPVDNCISVQITHDNGDNWEKIPCEMLGAFVPGEAAFAASDTNITITEKHRVVLATGGVKSRIWISETRGKSWKIIETPIVQGTTSTGIYSMDFYDRKRGIAIGGDYTQPENKENNLIRTQDGGINWEILDHPSHPSYRSCIQYIPGSNAKSLVAVGFQGIDISHDGGETWTHISDKNVYTIRFLNSVTAFAAGKNGVYRLDFF